MDTGVDYYDVTAIDGVNLPVEMKPDPESAPWEEREDPCKRSLGGYGGSISTDIDQVF